ncbi:MAG TPA: response regulator transcription factor [Bacteroidia bacterium]|nr:response regulator transcription factor [Bacteroidia bacterium]HNU33567.1 response regulator transcription factor [Bacteroidia bacterium]
MIQLAIVEDDKEILQSLINLISEDKEIVVVNKFCNAEDLISNFTDLNADVVLMDIGLPGKNGIQAVAELKPKKPHVQFVMCTIYDDEQKVFDALCVGATGYILKNSSPAELSEAIKIVYRGGSMMSATIARKVVESFQKRKVQANEAANLSPKQWEILNYLDQGFRYKEIADKMNLSFETVRTYCRNIYDVLQVHSRTDALNKVFPKN